MKTKKEIDIENQKEKVFREHLDAFNDGVIAIIITIMVLEIPIPSFVSQLNNFAYKIAIYVVSFLIVANFWYVVNRVFATFEGAKKSIIIADMFFLLNLSLIPVMTKWVIKEPNYISSLAYGLNYLLVQLCLFWILVAGNYQKLRTREIWTQALLRSILYLVPLILVVAFISRITVLVYLLLPIVSFLTPDKWLRKRKTFSRRMIGKNK